MGCMVLINMPFLRQTVVFGADSATLQSVGQVEHEVSDRMFSPIDIVRRYLIVTAEI